MVLYCKTYCSLNMFRAPLCPSSGAQDYYTDGCCLWYLVLQHPANRTHNPQLHTRRTTCKPKNQVPQAAAICITPELLMMGIMVPETCWANNKFCNKKQFVASSWPFIPRISFILSAKQWDNYIHHLASAVTHRMWRFDGVQLVLCSPAAGLQV